MEGLIDVIKIKEIAKNFRNGYEGQICFDNAPCTTMNAGNNVAIYVGHILDSTENHVWTLNQSRVKRYTMEPLKLLLAAPLFA